MDLTFVKHFGKELQVDVEQGISTNEAGIVNAIKEELAKKKIYIDSYEHFWGRGFNIFHYLFRSAQKQYHIKAPGTEPIYLEESRLNEVFIYKLLDILGYGPRYDYIVHTDIPGLLLHVNESCHNNDKHF